MSCRVPTKPADASSPGTRLAAPEVDPRARKLFDALSEILRSAEPANEPPRWVELAAEAKRRGMGTPALRQWCIKRGVTIRVESTRRAWVSPQEIDAAIELLPTARDVASTSAPVEPAAPAAMSPAEVERKVDEYLARRRSV